jgi:hypothetical protein
MPQDVTTRASRIGARARAKRRNDSIGFALDYLPIDLSKLRYMAHNSIVIPSVARNLLFYIQKQIPRASPSE